MVCCRGGFLPAAFHRAATGACYNVAAVPGSSFYFGHYNAEVLEAAASSPIVQAACMGAVARLLLQAQQAMLRQMPGGQGFVLVPATVGIKRSASQAGLDVVES